MEEKQGDVAVEGFLRALLGGLDEGEEVGKEGWPLLIIGAEEEEGECMGEFVAEDYIECHFRGKACNTDIKLTRGGSFCRT